MIHKVLKEKIEQAIQEVLPRVIQFRQLCHKHPERTWQEVETAKKVAEVLGEIPSLQVETSIGKLGVVATLEGSLPGPTIGLRADMDALALDEQTGLTYQSVNKGTMHACGHDGHMANLYGTALVLSRFRDELHGTVRFIFQPAEEGGAGALAMCQDGVLDGMDVIFGLHGWPEAPLGEIWSKDGSLMAANTQFKIEVTGTGCHAAMPHLGTDQILVAAKIIEALQSISSRTLAPTEPIALTVSKVNAGEAINIIPHKATLEGTLRTMNQSTRDRAVTQIIKIVSGLCSAHGVVGAIDFEDIYPATQNHRSPTDFLEKVITDVLGEKRFKRMEAPSMGAEDFAFYLQRIPGCFFFLGLRDNDNEVYPSLHNPKFDFNDKALPDSIMAFSSLALCSHLAEFKPQS